MLTVSSGGVRLGVGFAGDQTPGAAGFQPAGPLAVTQIQAAKSLGVTDRTIRNWEKQGRLIGRRVGGVKLYPWTRLCELAGVEVSNG